jgi:preprotein translocase subunit SecG
MTSSLEVWVEYCSGSGSGCGSGSGSGLNEDFFKEEAVLGSLMTATVVLTIPYMINVIVNS